MNNLWSVGKVAQKLGIGTHTVRHWTKQLTVPCHIGAGGHRYYDEDGLKKLQEIQNLMKNQGMRINSIANTMPAAAATIQRTIEDAINLLYEIETLI